MYVVSPCGSCFERNAACLVPLWEGVLRSIQQGQKDTGDSIPERGSFHKGLSLSLEPLTEAVTENALNQSGWAGRTATGEGCMVPLRRPMAHACLNVSRLPDDCVQEENRNDSNNEMFHFAQRA